MAILLRMPEVAASATEAILAGWPVGENIAFVQGDTIATVETEKAVVDVLADADGVMLKILVPVGTDVAVGDPIAILGDPGERVDDIHSLLVELGADIRSDRLANSEPVADVIAPAMADGTPSPNINEKHSSARVFSSPLARRLAKEAGISVEGLPATGRGGRIVRRDVERAVELASVAPTVATNTDRASAKRTATEESDASPYTDIPHTRMRRAIATRLTQSTQEAPHFYLNGTARVDRLLKLRTRLNNLGPAHVSITDLIVKAVGCTHIQVPEMNVIWTNNAVRKYQHVDVSVAVATDRGLVTPVVRNVDLMGLSKLALTSKELVERARAGSLRQSDLEGGSITVTNLGVFGIESFAAIINPPQSAILAVGGVRSEPVVSNGRIRIGRQIHFSLAVDHRPIDGAVAAQWMTAFTALIEDPIAILV